MKALLFLAPLLLVSCLDTGQDVPEPYNFEEQLATDVALIDEYLDANEIHAIVHESEIRYVITAQGDGASPNPSSEVTVTYKGTLLANGQLFDESQDPISFSLTRLIPAWQIMIPEMNEGGSMTIYAPSGYCYGPSGSRTIPPNANLIFEIDLISFQ